jgi:DNA-binding XRE family transcriptional regulator
MGLSKVKAAELLGLDRKTYSKYEDGEPETVPLYIRLAAKALLMNEKPI